MSHTPGPWVHRKGVIFSTGPTEHTVVVEMVGPNRVDRLNEKRANALLIAAAPDLYAACNKGLLALYGVLPACPDTQAAIKALEAAVVKAKGTAMKREENS